MRRTPCGYSVSIYADRRELLVFRTFLAVCQRAEKVFRHAERKPEGFLNSFLHILFIAHGFEHLNGGRFLRGLQPDPAIKEFFHVWGQLDHVSLGKKLRQSDAKAFAYRLKRLDRRDGISPEYVADRGLR